MAIDTLAKRYASLTFGVAGRSGTREPVGSSSAVRRASGLGLYGIEDSDVMPPELISATIISAGTEIQLVFTESVTGQTAFTLSASGGAVTMTGASGNGTSVHVFTLSRTVSPSETVTLDYDSVAGTSVDDAANDLASISAFPVGYGNTGSCSNLMIVRII